MSSRVPKILVVEDDPNFGEVLRTYLEMSDYHVTLCRDGHEGWTTYLDGKFDLCILDVMMPKMDGFTLAKAIRDKDKDIPIMFLTAKTLKEDVIEGLKIGADDYITKPFVSDELLLRVKAVLKRVNLEEEELPEKMKIGKYTYQYSHRLLIFGEEENKLSPKEAELLRLFCLNIGNVVDRSFALIKLWGEDNYFKARSMDVFIAKLRKRFEHDPNVSIENIHSNGFRLQVKEATSS